MRTFEDKPATENITGVLGNDFPPATPPEMNIPVMDNPPMDDVPTQVMDGPPAWLNDGPPMTEHDVPPAMPENDMSSEPIQVTPSLEEEAARQGKTVQELLDELLADREKSIGLFLNTVSGMQYPKNDVKNDLQTALSTYVGASANDSPLIENARKQIMGMVQEEIGSLLDYRLHNKAPSSLISESVRNDLEAGMVHNNVNKLATRELFKRYREDYVNNNLPLTDKGQPKTYRELSRDFKGKFEHAPNYSGKSFSENSPFVGVVTADLKDALEKGDTSTVLYSASLNGDYNQALKDIISKQYDTKNNKSFTSLFKDVDATTKEEHFDKAIQYLNQHNKDGAPTLNLMKTDSGMPYIKPDRISVAQSVFDEVKRHISNRISFKDDEGISRHQKNDEQPKEKVKNALNEAVKQGLNPKEYDNPHFTQGGGGGGYSIPPRKPREGLNLIDVSINAVGEGLGRALALGKAKISPFAHSALDKSVEAAKKVGSSIKHDFTHPEGWESSPYVKPDDNKSKVSSYADPIPFVTIDLAKKYQDLGENLFEAKMEGESSPFQQSVDNLLSKGNLEQIKNLKYSDAQNTASIVEHLSSQHEAIFDSLGKNDSLTKTEEILANRQQMEVFYDAIKAPLAERVRTISKGLKNGTIPQDKGNEDLSVLENQYLKASNLRNKEFNHYGARSQDAISKNLATMAKQSADLLSAGELYASLADTPNGEKYKANFIEQLEKFSENRGKLTSMLENLPPAASEAKTKEDAINFGRNVNQLMNFDKMNFENLMNIPEIQKLGVEDPKVKALLEKNSEEQRKTSEKLLKYISEVVEKIINSLFSGARNSSGIKVGA